MGDRLRLLWDFDDLDGTRERLRAQLAAEADDVGRAEVHTQLARVHGLEGDREGALRELRRAEHLAGAAPLVRCRVLLERGRLDRSTSGDLPQALAAFEAAFALATAPEAASWPPGGTAEFLAVDAAHMAALAADEREQRDAWARLAVARAEASDDREVRGWLASLYNNLAWEHEDAGEPEPALELFAAALREREQRPERESELAVARWALGRSLRRAGRAQEALPLLEQAHAWSERAGSPDGWFHEELALALVAPGSPESGLEDARERARSHARQALVLLPDADPAFAQDAQRVLALREIAGGRPAGRLSPAAPPPTAR